MITSDEFKKIGVSQCGVITPTDIEFSEDIRKICEGNSCRLYAKTWACPPAVGTVEACKERCLKYLNAVVFNAVYCLADPFDYEGMVAGHKEFKKLCDRVYSLATGNYSDFLLLSNEGCTRCKTCSYPEAPCRMPEMLFPSIEGYGINVIQLAKKARIEYNNGENTVTYFGMVLY